jgi:hypothetical protein
MEVDSAILKNVIFIGAAENGTFVPKATGFLVSSEFEKIPFTYVVTAEHVIMRMKSKGYDRPLFRINTPDSGFRLFTCEYDHWSSHPDSANKATDVVVCQLATGEAPIEFLALDKSMLFGADKLQSENVGIGDDVFMVGLFRSHFGKTKNVPIVRTGNIASMPGEPVHTKYCGDIDAFLIEARSISGLSGSPVYWRSPPVRIINGQLQIRHGVRFGLLGLMHGHFDIKNINEDIVTDSDPQRAPQGINTGIGVVIPAQKILDILDQPSFENARHATVQQLKQSNPNRFAQLVAAWESRQHSPS